MSLPLNDEFLIMNIRYKILYITMMMLLCGGTAFAQQVSVLAAIGQQEAYVGEPVDFQVQVTGSSSPSSPDLSSLKNDFVIKRNGGGPQKSSSITIINGKMTKVVKNDYLFSYTLTPKRPGAFVIPSIAVNIDGRQYRTQKLSLTAKKPMETDDFKLKLSLSKNRCYVGEAILLNIVWYLNKDVRGFDITLPILDNSDIFFADAHVDTSQGGYINLPIDGKDVVAKQASGRLGGKDYTTISFSKVLIPKKAGSIIIEPAQIMCESLIGYKAANRSSRDPFFADFSSFGSRRRAVYKRVVVPSNGLKLEVLPLPKEGRPADFAGHIGEYQVAIDASPLNVSVGDPITLRIQLSGPEYLDYVPAPDLIHQADLIHDFKVPADMGDGEVTRAGKLFTQTIRALRSDVKEIPPIKLPYFNTKSGKYSVAKSTSIPIKVKFSKVITAADAEGVALPAANGNIVESWSRGIAHNYSGVDLLENEHYGFSIRKAPKLLLLLIIMPPLLYVVILTVLLVLRYRENNSPTIRANKALARFIRSVRAVSGDDISLQLLNSLQEYLLHRLNLDHGVLTFLDVSSELSERGVRPEVLNALKEVFNECEAGHFGGGVAGDGLSGLSEKIISVVRSLEKELKK